MKIRNWMMVGALVLALLFSLCACGGDSGSTSTNIPDTPDDTDAYEYEVEVVGAELFTDSDNRDAIRIYYDFTNNSEETKSPLLALTINAQQGGADLEMTFAAYDETVAESGLFAMGVRPGVSIRCAEEYVLDPNGGVVTLTIGRGWLDETPMVVELDPTALSMPTDEFVLETIEDPAWTDELDDKGLVNDVYEMYIDNAEIVENSDGNEVLRVYLNFTNNSDEAKNFFSACSTIAYQDGVQLEADYSVNSVAEDANYSVEIEPGETIRVTRCFALRSNSEVEVEVFDDMGMTVLGTSYTLE